MKKQFILLVLTVAYASSSNAQFDAIPLGNGPNALSCAGKSRSNLWYDKDLNTISFIHTSDTAITGDANPGYLRYDVSLTGGIFWNENRGPVYSNISDKR